jgi:hypothetical protein
MFLPRWEILYKKGSIALYTETIHAIAIPKNILRFGRVRQCLFCLYRITHSSTVRIQSHDHRKFFNMYTGCSNILARVAFGQNQYQKYGKQNNSFPLSLLLKKDPNENETYLSAPGRSTLQHPGICARAKT